MLHTIIALDVDGNTVDNVESFEDFGLALEELRLMVIALDKGYTYRNNPKIVGYELDSSER